MNRLAIPTAYVLLSAVAFCAANCSPKAKPKSASVVLTFSPRGEMLCEVNGRAITVLSDELRNLYRLNGQDMRLNLFFHEDANITHISQFMSVIGKVGFRNVHIYLFDRNKSGMTEVSLGKKLPFTLDP